MREDWLNLAPSADGPNEMPVAPGEDRPQRHTRWPVLAGVGLVILAVVALAAVRLGGEPDPRSGEGASVAVSTATPAAPQSSEPVPGFQTTKAPESVDDAAALAVVARFEAARRGSSDPTQRELALSDVASLRLARSLAVVDPADLPEVRSEPRVTGHRQTETMVAAALADGSRATYVVGIDRGAPRVIAAGRERAGAPTATMPAERSP